MQCKGNVTSEHLRGAKHDKDTCLVSEQSLPPPLFSDFFGAHCIVAQIFFAKDKKIPQSAICTLGINNLIF